MRKILSLFFLSVAISSVKAQDYFPGPVSIGTATADASSILDVHSETKGMLIPRMSTSGRNAIASPATGLLVYDTDLHSLYQHTSTGWQRVQTSLVNPTITNPTIAAGTPVSFAGTAATTGAIRMPAETGIANGISFGNVSLYRHATLNMTLVNSGGMIVSTNLLIGNTGIIGNAVQSDRGFIQFSSAGLLLAANITGAGSAIRIQNQNAGSTGDIVQFLNNNTTPVAVINQNGRMAIGAATVAASAMLDLTSTSRGFLTPRMTTTERNGIASPATGLEIYNTETKTKDIYNGTAWVALGDESAGWNVNGNTITSGQYLGTKNDQPLVFKTNSDADASAKAVILSNGNMGIGTATPEYKLDITPASGNYMAARLKGNILMWDDGVDQGDSRAIQFRALGVGSNVQTGSIYLDGYGPAGGEYLKMNSSGAMRFSAAKGYYEFIPLDFNPSNSVRLIAQNGEMALGTNSINKGIKLFNSTTQTLGNLFQLSNNGTNVMTVTAGTHLLGIGTETPEAQLHTTGSVRFAGLASSEGTRYLVSDNAGNIGYTTTGGGSGGGLWTTNGGNISNTNTTGWVCIGRTSAATVDPLGNFKLYVEGGIRARKVKIDPTATAWPDFVFEKDYHLPTLTEVENYIQINKHLPGIKSAEEITKEGLDLGDNQAALLQKIEELTLYMIEQNKKMASQQQQITDLTQQVQKLAPAVTTNK